MWFVEQRFERPVGLSDDDLRGEGERLAFADEDPSHAEL